MKQINRTILLLCVLVGQAQCMRSQTMLIASSNGTNATYPLTEILNVVFTNNTLVVDNGDCQKHHYSVFFTDYITLDGSIQVDEAEEGSALVLFPNPSAERITLRSAEAQLGAVKVYNATGVLVHTTTVYSSTCEIDVRTWASGMYIIVNNGQTLQFVKQ